MRRLLLLAIVSECLGFAGTIHTVWVSGTAGSPPLDFIWAQVTYTNQPLSSARVDPYRVGERWEFGADGYAEIPFTITFPPLILPPDAVIQSQFLYWAESDPGYVSLSKTVSVSPVVEDCDGEPCPYSPADFGVMTQAYANVDTSWNDDTGAGIAGHWWVGFYSVDGTGILISPGYNAVTTIRWTLGGQLGMEASLIVEYESPDVPEPSTTWLLAAGVGALLAFRAPRRLGQFRAH